MNTIPNDVAEKALGLPSAAVAEEFSKLRTTIIELYDERVWFLTKAALAVNFSCMLADITNPVALILVDGPSTEKTTVLDFLEGLPMSYRLDKFTPASFLTQATTVKKNKIGEVDLLPKIAYKTMIVPELAPLFNQPKETLLESYALLARVLDGQGLVNAGGVHGTRSLTGDYIFGLLGATTPLSQTAWNTMGKVGSRLLFLNAPSKLSAEQRRQRSLDIMTSKLHYKTKRKRAKDAVQDFAKFLVSHYEPTDYKVPEDAPKGLDSQEALIEHCGYLPRSIEWDQTNDNEEVIEKIAILAEFLTAARSDVRVWTERNDEGKSETNSSGVVNEGVDRFTALVYNLARSHALVSGRRGIDSDDLPLIIAVTLSSLPDDRHKLIELLVSPSRRSRESEPDTITTTEFKAATNWNVKTALKVMEKLKMADIGTVKEGFGSVPTSFILHDRYSWLLSDEFQSCYRQWDKTKPEPDSESVILPF